MTDPAPIGSPTLPRVSVCIPTYNNATMVGDAIASARSQDYPSLEILVLDNHSSDDTPEAVRRSAGDDPRVRYVRHPSNLGMDGNFNAAIETASGELLLILCADDVLRPGCVEHLATALASHPSCVLAACGRVVVDAALREQETLSLRSSPQVVAGETLILECFAADNRIGEPSAVMFRREAARRGFRADYSQVIDLEMWFHLLAQGDGFISPRPLACIRRHSGQLSESNKRSGRLLHDKRSFFREFAPTYGRKLRWLQKLRWDARMASTLWRTRSAGGVRPPRLDEIFYPSIFPALQVAVDLGYFIRRHASMPSRVRSA